MVHFEIIDGKKYVAEPRDGRVRFCEMTGCNARGDPEEMMQWPSGDEPWFCPPHMAEILKQDERDFHGQHPSIPRAKFHALEKKAELAAAGWFEAGSRERARVRGK